eukprot:gene15230-15376_t
MSHPFLIKEIAVQAGVSEATVDRVLNERGNVRRHTCQRVQQAIRELEGQRLQTGMSGRKFVVDMVIHAPSRFSNAVRTALEAEMPNLQPAVFRARYHFSEETRTQDMVALLDKIAKRGSHGVLLKAADAPDVAAAVNRLAACGIPVITLVTDVINCRRHAYVGMDNRAAGETAAHIIGEWLGPAPAKVLASLSSNRFRGEEEREIGFRRHLRVRYPQIGIVDVSEGLGVGTTTGALVTTALEAHPDICAVYSIGGGNIAIIEAFKSARRPCKVFIAHDLDADNLHLLRTEQISAVLHHDLRQDMRTACQHLMRAHHILPTEPRTPPSQVQIITAFNLPNPQG